MRALADTAAIERFMRALGHEATAPVRVYFTGGATAVLHGWRASTIDVDIKFDPERDELYRAIYHFDLYAQALAKIERGHDGDLGDVSEMIRRGMIDTGKLLEYFETIEPKIYRYPAIDAASFRAAVERIATSVSVTTIARSRRTGLPKR